MGGTSDTAISHGVSLSNARMGGGWGWGGTRGGGGVEWGLGDRKYVSGGQCGRFECKKCVWEKENECDVLSKEGLSEISG